MCMFLLGFPRAASGKEPACLCWRPKRRGYDPWVRKIPCRSKYKDVTWDFPGGAVVENPPTNAGDTRDVGSIPGSGKSPGGGCGSPRQYSCLGNPTDRGAWQATVHGVAKSQTRLSD